MTRKLTVSDVLIKYLSNGISACAEALEQGAKPRTLRKMVGLLAEHDPQRAQALAVDLDALLRAHGATGKRGRTLPHVGDARVYRAQTIPTHPDALFVRLPVDLLVRAKGARIEAFFFEDRITLRALVEEPAEQPAEQPAEEPAEKPAEQSDLFKPVKKKSKTKTEPAPVAKTKLRKRVAV